MARQGYFDPARVAVSHRATAPVAAGLTSRPASDAYSLISPVAAGTSRWFTSGTATASYTQARLTLAVYAAHPFGRVQAHDPLTGKVYWARAVGEFAGREAEVAGPPTVDKADGWQTREVFVPVTLTSKNNGDKRAAVAKFVDRLVE
jgi:hypothetical protein